MLASTADHSKTCHLYSIKIGEGEYKQPKTIGTISKGLGYSGFSDYFKNEGSFAQFVFKTEKNASSKMVFLRDSIYVVDQNDGAPRFYKGNLPDP